MRNHITFWPTSSAGDRERGGQRESGACLGLNQFTRHSRHLSAGEQAASPMTLRPSHSKATGRGALCVCVCACVPFVCTVQGPQKLNP